VLSFMVLGRIDYSGKRCFNILTALNILVVDSRLSLLSLIITVYELIALIGAVDTCPAKHLSILIFIILQN